MSNTDRVIRWSPNRRRARAIPLFSVIGACVIGWIKGSTGSFELGLGAPWVLSLQAAPPMSDAPRPALMLAIMEPPPGMEEEFNDWYDTEHLPQRRGLPGFLSASRWVALDGFPRSLAAYDLQSLAALSDPAYLAVAGVNSTPWSRRVLARTTRAGRLRVEAELISPGGRFLPPHTVSRMLVARYAVSAGHAAFAGEAAERYGSLPRLAQYRLFRSGAAAEIWALAEFWGPVHFANLTGLVGEVAGRGATFFNLYAPYNSATPAGQM